MSQSSRPLGIGLNLPTWPGADGAHTSWAEMRGLARDAESLGVDMLWVPDHLVRVLPTGRVVGFRECWTILTAAAEATSTIGIGPFVACTGFRNPGLLAQMAETLDEVSGGRLVLGLGSGVPASDTSWAMFGFDGARHVGRFAESVEVVTRLLRGETVTFEGEHVRLRDAALQPRGPRPAGAPVWVAAKGERTMDVAARWADAVNVNTALAGPEDVIAAAAAAAEACARVGRDPATLALTGWCRVALEADGRAVGRPGWIGGAPEEVAATLRSMAALGLRHVAVYVGVAGDPSPLPALSRTALERFAAVLEAVRGA